MRKSKYKKEYLKKRINFIQNKFKWKIYIYAYSGVYKVNVVNHIKCMTVFITCDKIISYKIFNTHKQKCPSLFGKVLSSFQ